jgi:hypothetical protein
MIDPAVFIDWLTIVVIHMDHEYLIVTNLFHYWCTVVLYYTPDNYTICW